MTSRREAHYALVFDTGDRVGSIIAPGQRGIVTDRDAYLHGVAFDLTAGTLKARFRVHRRGDGTPEQTDPAYYTCAVDAQQTSVNVRFNPPLLANGGFEFGITVSATSTARGFIYYTFAR